ncbi:flagellar filament capping protein FliD [Psychrobacillus sp. Sa2BUA9]|uniref:Flagellar hook-associated protein 2 n=1 Tax=Psychrobacillus faecigallinarum TaxID=2762235 RepID=A0ABR8R5F9_9BACI|nr:flagellar filament capping protein FliD [Psychrobacillus faecigallinarum]MBD7943029.1 flagellar filament capping protein FliD [Psychrobacillus faecigallinarum]
MAGLRIGGLASGMDIDQIVGDLMKAQRVPLDKLVQKKTTFEWQRDSYRSINTKLKSFDTYLVDNFLISSNFNKKKAESSNSNLVNATATGSASSNLSIEGVSQLASAARQIGNTISTSNGGTVSGATKMGELSGFTGDTSISLKAIQADGTLAKEATKIDISASDTIDQVVKKINESNAGVSALFENGKLSITAKNTGDLKGEAEVQVVDGENVFNALGMTEARNLATGGTNAVFQVNGISTERASNTFNLAGYNVTLQSTFNVKNTLEQQVIKLQEAKTMAAQDVINAISARDASKVAAEAQQSTFDGIYTPLTTEQKNTYQLLVTDKTSLRNALANISETDFSTFKGLVESEDGKINNAAIDAAEISDDAKKMLKSLSDGERSQLRDLENAEFNLYGSVAKEEIKLEISNKQKVQAEQDLVTKEQKKIQLDAEYDSIVEKNNNTPQDSNVSSVQLKSSTDIDSMVDKVKEFVTKYNELISGMNDSLKEKKYRDYPPLTDEQRKDMSESEQKLWDEKAKSGLLRSDSIVSNGLSNMRNSIYGKVGNEDNIIDTLAEMGITTSNIYSDGGKLVINDEKLRKALTENPDQVVKTITSSGTKTETEDSRGIVKRLRDSMKDLTTNIETKAGKASSTDQQYSIGKSLIDTNTRITNFQRRLEDMEARYWKQFTAMETAINKANSQSGYLSQFGQS